MTTGGNLNIFLHNTLHTVIDILTELATFKDLRHLLTFYERLIIC